MNRSSSSGSGPAESSDERKDRLLRAVIVALVVAVAVLAAGGVVPWIVAGTLTLVGAVALNYSPPRRRLRAPPARQGKAGTANRQVGCGTPATARAARRPALVAVRPASR
jgi:hypothetical protein